MGKDLKKPEEGSDYFDPDRMEQISQMVNDIAVALKEIGKVFQAAAEDLSVRINEALNKRDET